MSTKRSLALASVIGVASVAALAGPAPAGALAGTVSASQFASACGSGPVSLMPSVKVEFGTAAIPGGCTVNVPFDGALEIVDATLSFGGPLVVNGGEKSKLEVVNSSVVATSVTVSMNANETSVKVDKGSLRASAGDVSITMGRLGRVQIAYPSPTNPISLKAAGGIVIVGGDLLKTELNNARIEASAFRLDMNGVEGGVKAEGATVVTTGALQIVSSGSKGLIESSGSTFQSGTSTEVSMNGAESLIKGTATAFRSNGAVTIASSANAFGGLVELGGPGGVISGSSVSIVASAGAAGDKGVVKVGLNSITATSGTIAIRSGQQGTTEIKEASVTAAVSVTVASAPTGVCKAELNTITAPATSICV